MRWSPKLSFHLLRSLCYLLQRSQSKSWVVKNVSNLLSQSTSMFLFVNILVYIQNCFALNYTHTAPPFFRMWACCNCDFTLTSQLVLRNTWEQMDSQKNTGTDIAAAFSQSPDVVQSHCSLPACKQFVCLMAESKVTTWLRRDAVCNGMFSFAHYTLSND